MTLNDWLKNDWLKKHTTSAEEVRDLLLKVERDLSEASKTQIGLDWRLAIAYNACLGCATIALRVSGYRTPEGDGHHFRTIESLRYTLNPSSDLITALQALRKKRAVVSYDAAGTVTEAEVWEALEIARELSTLLRAWLQTNHPNLLDSRSFR
jgi:hypothetical protein